MNISQLLNNQEITKKYSVQFLMDNMDKIKQKFTEKHFLAIVKNIVRNNQINFVQSDDFKLILHYYYKYDMLIQRNTIFLLKKIARLDNIKNIIEWCPDSDLYDLETRLLHFAKYNPKYYEFLSVRFTFDELVFINSFENVDYEVLTNLPIENRNELYIKLKMNDNFPLIDILPYIEKVNTTRFDYIETIYFAYMISKGRNEVINEIWNQIDILYFNMKHMEIFQVLTYDFPLIETQEIQLQPVRTFKKQQVQKALEFIKNLFQLYRTQNTYSILTKNLMLQVYNSNIDFSSQEPELVTRFNRVGRLKLVNLNTTGVHDKDVLQSASMIFEDFVNHYIPKIRKEKLLEEYAEMYDKIKTLVNLQGVTRIMSENGKKPECNRMQPEALEIEKQKENLKYRQFIYQVIGEFPDGFQQAVGLIDIGFKTFLTTEYNFTGEIMIPANENELKKLSGKYLLGAIWHLIKENIEKSTEKTPERFEKELELKQESFYNALYGLISAQYYGGYAITCYPGKIGRLVDYVFENFYTLSNGKLATRFTQNKTISSYKDILDLFERIRLSLTYRNYTLKSFLEILFSKLYQNILMDQPYSILNVLNFLFFFDGESLIKCKIGDWRVFTEYEFNVPNYRKSYAFINFNQEYREKFEFLVPIIKESWDRVYATFQNVKIIKNSNNSNNFKEDLRKIDDEIANISDTKNRPMILKIKNNTKLTLLKENIDQVTLTPLDKDFKPDPDFQEIQNQLMGDKSRMPRIQIPMIHFKDIDDIHNILEKTGNEPSVIDESLTLQTRKYEKQLNPLDISICSENKLVDLSVSEKLLEIFDNYSYSL